MGQPQVSTRTFRLPRSAYLAVLFFIVGSVPLALADSQPHSLEDSAAGTAVAGFELSPRLLVLVLPVLAAVFIARTATIVDADGIRVRAAFGSRRIAWDQLRGLNVADRSVYAVVATGSVRLPCVRIAHLAELARVSAGRLPAMPDPVYKPAPSRRSRRR